MRQRYILLDGLRGVAALMVLGYHLFEAVAFAAGAKEQNMFHGFLAVDFFLILSGFVMGNAYDEEWKTMSVGNFFRRRLVRLHPMILVGVAIGLVTFVLQGRSSWTGQVAGWGQIALTTLLALFLLPSPTTLDLRGNTEMFPLNGPHWSLFFEYIGNILYALLLRKVSTKALKIIVLFNAAMLLVIGIFGPDGCIAYGWSSKPINILGGFLRMWFDYPAGLLLARLFRERRPDKLNGPVFACCACALMALLCVPSLGKLKVAYEIICATTAFPLLIWTGARADIKDAREIKAITFLGDISYPLYAVHYPFIYLYIDWINKGINPFGSHQWCTPVAIAAISITVSVICMKFYDKPVRKRLSRLL